MILLIRGFGYAVNGMAPILAIIVGDDGDDEADENIGLDHQF